MTFDNILSVPVSEVDDFHDNESIASCFAGKYKSLFISVESGKELMVELRRSVNRSIDSTYDRECSHIRMFSEQDIRTSIKSLRACKNEGVDPISSDCFKHTTDLMIYFIKCILNLMISHGHIPKSFLKATVVPIPKNIRLDCNVSSSYRAIALTLCIATFCRYTR